MGARIALARVRAAPQTRVTLGRPLGEEGSSMRVSWFGSAAAVVSITLLVSKASGQVDSSDLRAFAPLTPEAVEPGTQQAREYRSPTLASVLSLSGGFIGIHGLGSYYAGNEPHGTRHLLLGFGTGAVVLAGLLTCDGGWGSGECVGVSGAVVTLGVLAYLVNWGWSVVTAGQDAKAFNVLAPAGGRFLSGHRNAHQELERRLRVDIPIAAFLLGGS